MRGPPAGAPLGERGLPALLPCRYNLRFLHLTGRSFNGRTPRSGRGYRGSNPCLPAKLFRVAAIPIAASVLQPIHCLNPKESHSTPGPAGGSDPLVELVSELCIHFSDSAADGQRGDSTPASTSSTLLDRFGNRERPGPVQDLLAGSVQANHVVPALGDGEAVWRLL